MYYEVIKNKYKEEFLPIYVDINAYFKKYGQSVTEETESFIFPYSKKLFENQIEKIKKLNPELNLHFFEIESPKLNAAAIRVDLESYAIILRNGIFDNIKKDFELHEKHFEAIKEEFVIFDMETIFSFYIVFVYSYLIGHELGHVLYGHFKLNDTINAIEENASLVFNNNESDKDILQQYNKNLLKMYMELNADMYGAVVLSEKIIELGLKSLIDKINIPLVSFIKIAISSIYCVQNLFMQTHPIGKSDYPHPTVRLSFLIDIITRQLSQIYDPNKIEFNIKETIDKQLMEIMNFSEDNKLGNSRIDQQDVSNDIQKDIDAAKQGFNKFYSDMEQYFFKLF